jgi:hypothetical protein
LDRQEQHQKRTHRQDAAKMAAFPAPWIVAILAAAFPAPWIAAILAALPTAWIAAILAARTL